VGINVASYVGHATIRRSVMGAAASERPANDDEILAMQRLLHAAMSEGAAGLSTSQLDIHADHDGRPVPCNFATASEIVALSSVLGEFDEGFQEILCRSFTEGYSSADRELLRGMATASGAKPLHVNMLLRFPVPGRQELWRECMSVLEGFSRDGLRVYPMACANPKGIHIVLADTIMLDEMPAFRRVLSLPMEARKQQLRDDAVRQTLRREFDDKSHRDFVFDWRELVVSGVRDRDHHHLVGRSVAEMAAERDLDELDTFLDLALSEDLETVFIVDRPVSDEDRDVVRFLLRHPLCTAGSSDAGAHLTTFCGADYSTRVLTDYAGEEGFSFEQAISKLTQMPALACGLSDRGAIRIGAAVDLVLLDPAQLAAGSARLVRDFPAGASRLVIDQKGYHSTIVNGSVVIENGAPTGSLPGSVIRFNGATSPTNGR
jgi:N-acyl-D-aspartate/D-glutamate deacylase